MKSTHYMNYKNIYRIMLILVFGLLVLRYEEVFCLSEHSLITNKEQEVGISCVDSIKNTCFLKYY